jgi:outer membrane protein assembly factor BamB
MPWPVFRHDFSGSGRADYVGADVSALKWVFTTGANVYSSPVLGQDGRVYIGSTDGRIYCLDSAGAPIWSFDTKGTVKYAAPAVASDGTIYATAYNNGSQPEAMQGLLALTPDGQLKWHFSVTVSPLHSPMLAPSGDICFGSNGGGIYCVRPDGTMAWQYGNYKVFSAMPVFDAAGIMYASDISGRVQAVNPNGTRKWAVNMGGMADRAGCAVGPDGRIYVGAADGRLYAFTDSGTVAWTCSLGGPVYSAPALGDGCAYMTAGDGRLHAVGYDGVKLWAAPVRHPESSPCVDFAGKIYVGSQCFSPAGALLSDCLPAPVTVSAPAVGLEGTVYVGAGAGLLALSTGPVPQPQFNKAPICAIQASPISGPAPLAVTFVAVASDPDGDPLTAEWDFGDGSLSAGMETGHVFTAPGEYLVTLAVRDGRGGSATAEVFVSVSQPNQPPTVTLLAEIVGSKLPVVVRFTAVAEDPEGGVLQVAWDFGDGDTAEGGLTAEHLYSVPGTYVARVTVTDDAGASATDEVVIEGTTCKGKHWGLIKHGWETYWAWLVRWLQRGHGKF